MAWFLTSFWSRILDLKDKFHSSRTLPMSSLNQSFTLFTSRVIIDRNETKHSNRSVIIWSNVLPFDRVLHYYKCCPSGSWKQLEWAHLYVLIGSHDITHCRVIQVLFAPTVYSYMISASIFSVGQYWNPYYQTISYSVHNAAITNLIAFSNKKCGTFVLLDN